MKDVVNTTEDLFPDGKGNCGFRKCSSVEELSKYITELVKYNHDYNTVVYAIVKGLLATEHFFAHACGTTGAQHGFAQMAFMRATRNVETSCMFLNGDDLMYPQYNIPKMVQDWIEDTVTDDDFINIVKKSFIETDEDGEPQGSPEVMRHWAKLIGVPYLGNHQKLSQSNGKEPKWGDKIKTSKQAD